MTLYTVTMTLILVMDPLGNIPVFLSILHRFTAERRRMIILREVIIACIILVFFLFFGKYFINWLHLSSEAISIAGGIILFLIALRMIFPPEKKENSEVEQEEPFVVPLAIPLIAGPSTLATVLLFSTEAHSQNLLLLVAIMIASIIFLAIMLCSGYLMRVLGKRGLIAIERLMGMVLTTLSVQMFLTGVMHFMRHS